MLLLLLLLPGLPLLWADLWGTGRRGGGAGAAAHPGSHTQFLHGDPGYRLAVRRNVMVEEGLCVFVPCNVSYPREGWNDSTPAHGYWFWSRTTGLQDGIVATNNPGRKVKAATQGRFRLLGDPRTRNCSLDIRDAQRRDTGTYFFRVERGSSVRYNYKWDQISVNVTGKEWGPGGHPGMGPEGSQGWTGKEPLSSFWEGPRKTQGTRSRGWPEAVSSVRGTLRAPT